MNIAGLTEIYFKYDEWRLKKEIKRHPYEGKLYLELAQLYFKKGYINRSENQLKKAVEIQPYVIGDLLSEISKYSRKMQYENALILTSLGIKYDKKHSFPFHFYAATIYCNIDESDRALSEFQETLRYLDDYKIEGKENLREESENRISQIKKTNRCY